MVTGQIDEVGAMLVTDQIALLLIISALAASAATTVWIYFLIFRAVEQRLARLTKAKVEVMARELHEFLSIAQTKDEYRDLEIQRYVLIQIYLEQNSIFEPEMQRRLAALLQHINIEISDEYQAQTGSWLKKFIGRTMSAISQAELDEQLSNAKRAMELVLVEKQQAEVDKDKADAAMKLASALGDSGYGIIGSIVVVKIQISNDRSETQIYELTQEQLMQYRRIRNSGKVISTAMILDLVADGQLEDRQDHRWRGL